MKQVFLSRMPEDSFTWSRWREFNLFSLLGIACRTGDIICRYAELQKHAIGWTNAESLLCRPKKDSMAVMWLEGDSFTWCHLTKDEFNKLFATERKEI